MSLENTVLQKLAEAPGSARRHELEANHPESGWTLYLTAERRDDLSCLAWELTLRRAAARGDLQAWAEAIAARTVSLTERLSIYEIDATRNEGLLRTAPVQRQGQTLYFEVRLQGTSSLTLRRFQAPRETGERREQVAFALTSETLGRLVGELAGA